MEVAKKPAVIGFLAIIGLELATFLIAAISALLTLLVPVLVIVTKAAIFGHILFLAGLIAINIKEQCQKKETPTVIMLLLCKPCKKYLKPRETIQNDVLITPPSAETIVDHCLRHKPVTWQQQILKEIQQDTWELPTENKPKTTPEFQNTDIISYHDINLLNNQLAIPIVCWQAINRVTTLLDAIKASEMKIIASELEIPKYRKMNKTQLLIEIVEAYDNAPAFSQ
jgi:hypothetical protein